MRIRLDLIESRLQILIEQWMVPVARKDFHSRLAHQMVQALQQYLLTSVDLTAEGTHTYTIFLNPSMVVVFDRQENLLANLALAMQEAAREAELFLPSPPTIHLEPDDRLAYADFRVEAVQPPERTGSTAVLRLSEAVGEHEMVAMKAFLIINGVNLFPLDQPVINIGRRTDNHIVIDDPRVSRSHAQIRFSRGAFILFDLNSTGGTRVNGQAIRQASLKPGDVISLSGFPLIYGEEPADTGDTGDTGQTQSMQSPPS